MDLVAHDLKCHALCVCTPFMLCDALKEGIVRHVYLKNYAVTNNTFSIGFHLYKLRLNTYSHYKRARREKEIN